MGYVSGLVIVLAIMAGYWWTAYPAPEGCPSPVQYKLLKSLVDVVLTTGQIGEDYFGQENFKLNLFRKVVQPIEDVVSKGNIVVRVEHFDGVRCLVYTPDDRVAEYVLFYVHGGAWVIGSPDLYHPILRQLAEDTGALVVAPNYRLAPETVFPGAIDDVVKSYKSLSGNLAKYAVKKKDIVVAGDSAGGNLVAALTLRLRDEKFHKQPKSQMVINPMLQSIDFNTPSYHLYSGTIVNFYKDSMMHYLKGNKDLQAAIYNDSFIPKETFIKLQEKYLNVDTLPTEMIPGNLSPKPPKDGDYRVWDKLKDLILNPYFSPIVADDLSSLPPGCILTAGQDVLRDEGFWYYHRLKQAGNDIQFIYFKDAHHSSLNEMGDFYYRFIKEIKASMGGE